MSAQADIADATPDTDACAGVTGTGDGSAHHPAEPDAAHADAGRHPAFALHRGGKMAIAATVPVQNRDDLSLAYTPGVAEVCTAIAERPELAHEYTWTSQV
ncbi:NAD-dependent malic enzyme, partial [Streptomyces sp. SID11233]|nr:NAD-dependent malic enzyme [Streptomyces sp. SID11233]